MAAVGEPLDSIDLIYVTLNFEIIMFRNMFLGIAPPLPSIPLQTNCYHVIDMPFEEHIAITCVI